MNCKNPKYGLRTQKATDSLGFVTFLFWPTVELIRVRINFLLYDIKYLSAGFPNQEDSIFCAGSSLDSSFRLVNASTAYILVNLQQGLHN